MRLSQMNFEFVFCYIKYDDRNFIGDIKIVSLYGNFFYRVMTIGKCSKGREFISI